MTREIDQILQRISGAIQALAAKLRLLGEVASSDRFHISDCG